MKTFDSGSSNDDDLDKLWCHMQREIAEEHMKDNVFAIPEKNEKCGINFGVDESGIYESGLLKDLAGLKIGSNKDKTVKVNNKYISLDPGIKGEEDKNCKHETEGYREIKLEKRTAKLLDYYTRTTVSKAFKMKEGIAGAGKALL